MLSFFVSFCGVASPGNYLASSQLLHRVAQQCKCLPARMTCPCQCRRSVLGVCLLLAILTFGASGDLACPALAGIWMNMAGNKTNDFYAQLEPYVDFSEGAVGPNPHTALPSSCRFCQRISDSMILSKPVSYLPTACPEEITI